ncbi:acetolactate synthase 3 large subunit [Rhizobium grahamii]|uniref:Acetolactate synthase n=1 Tax=Rhizobium grahamii TaxID=1120045 RepID=A0A370KKI3_9HYPH|nr:acetolactate synthase 3 large subunit [Rhizobium grahamii]RDJ08681.1 acetolactate synthase 3 large subunit [Rhizobium grahamii]
MTINITATTPATANSDEITGAAMIVRALADQGAEVLFGYPGGAVLPIYDALLDEPRLRHILVRHEQGAAHAAEGYARSSGKPGVVLVTSGPGAINTVVGIVDALMDSIPLIVITGQVPTHLIGTDAFQEADTIGITRSCTKHNYLVRSIEELPHVMHEAYRIATTGRPGPVLIDIPKDIQVARGRYSGPREAIPLHRYEPQIKGNPGSIAEAIKLLSEARRPILYTGGGVINSGPKASARLREFTALVGAPVTSTLMGLGAFPASDDLWLGMPGMHGAYEANHAMHDCDVMLCLGARFDDRVTGRLDAFSPGSRKIHVDIDPSSIGKIVPVDVGIVGDALSVLEDLIAGWPRQRQQVRKERLAPWWKQIETWRARKAFSYRNSSEVIKPQYALERLRALTLDSDVYVTTEVGQHQMWAAQFFHLSEPNRWMTSGGLGTMGYGLPAAIGVQLAHPRSVVIDIAGEASILMNMQEMSTAVQYRLPVKIFILNNEYMGMIRQWQELLHDERYSHSYSESLPDFVKLAEAYGAVGIRAEKPEELDGKIIEMLNTPRPVIFDCRVEKTENCLPMIPSGKPHNEMILADEIVDMGSVISAEGRALV